MADLLALAQYRGDMLTPIPSPATTKLMDRFKAINQMHLSGSLGVQNKHGTWREICFYMGRLVWSNGEDHRIRRWLRCMGQACPQIKPDVIRKPPREGIQYWEYLILKALIQRQQITRVQAIVAIEKITAEVLFDILQDAQRGDLNYRFIQQKIWDSPICALNLEPTLDLAEKLMGEWCNLGLVDRSPNLAPLIENAEEFQRRMSPKAYQSMADLLNGNLTVRDLAVKKRQDLITIARLLLPYLSNDLIGLREVEDLANSPSSNKPDQKSIARSGSAKIICIDDNPNICRIVGNILTQAGYQYASVQDSVQALPALLEHKPSLILLDLVMPVANGYEICSQIRRISMFQQTPIVILTGNDGIVDRVRAKVVGASDFLAKPVQSEKLLSVVQKYVAVPPQSPIQTSEVSS